ncbi:MAG: hypothetical protein E6767_14265 [Dysgonomonas sp.]|nr:hypothetical protein [Dysgonomonas sp.]
MKKLIYLSFVVLAMSFSIVSCSDDDDPEPTPPPTNTELKKVLDKLADMENVSDFTNALKNASGIDVGNDIITVFAIKDQPELKATLNEGSSTTDLLKGHIAKGAYDLSELVSDSLVIKGIDGKPIAITQVDGDVYINGVLLPTPDATKAGDNCIYVVDDTLPQIEIKEYTANFVVSEANEQWAEDADEKSVSKDALVRFFTYYDDSYVCIDSVLTNEEGKAEYKHFRYDNLFYSVSKGTKTQFRFGYLVKGLFTSQSQIDNAPTYSTGTNLDNLELGGLMASDLNGDGTVDNNDKIDPPYIKVDNAATKTEVFVVSPDYKNDQD